MSAGILFLLGLIGLLAAVGGPAVVHAGGTLLAAHRGGAQLWPENSLLAFRNAVALGADFLEFDVHLSRDGHVVVIHDPTLERTTTGAGPVSDRTLAELRGLRLKGRDGKVTEERIPTLDEVMDLAAPTPVRLLLEIKVDAQRRRYPGIEEKILGTLDRHGMAARTIVMAFEEATIRRISALRPDLTAGGLYSPKGLAEANSTVVREIEGQRGLGGRFVGLHQELVTAEVVKQAERVGVLLGVWTVNDAGAMKRFMGMGVGILITDRPDLAREVRGR